MQGLCVRSLVGELDPTCPEAKKYKKRSNIVTHSVKTKIWFTLEKGKATTTCGARFEFEICAGQGPGRKCVISRELNWGENSGAGSLVF